MVTHKETQEYLTRAMPLSDWRAWPGIIIILAGIACQIIQLAVSIRDRKQHRDLTGDPWNGRTLEWSTASPPPAWNFAVLPEVCGRDAWWSSKQSADQSAPVPAPVAAART